MHVYDYHFLHQAPTPHSRIHTFHVRRASHRIVPQHFSRWRPAFSRNLTLRPVDDYLTYETAASKESKDMDIGRVCRVSSCSLLL